MRRRTVELIVAAAGAAAVLAGCGGASLEDRVEAAELRVRDLEDRYRDIRTAIPTTVVAGRPPSTLRPSPTTVPTAPTLPPETAPTTELLPGADIPPASEGDLRSIIGGAQWDYGLPVPASCLATASFTPNGPDGIGGGTLQCRVDAPPDAVLGFVRRVNAERNLIANDGGSSFTYGNVASIGVGPDGAGSSFTAQQQYPFTTEETTP